MNTLDDNLPDYRIPSPVGAASEPTLARRIAFKSLAGFVALPLNVLLQLMVPRALGAAAYGEYSYLSAFFTSVMAFGDSGSSQAFYNKASQRPREYPLYRFYARFSITLFALLLGGVGIAYALGAAPVVWPKSSSALVWLAAVMVFGNWAISIASKAIDANALTGSGETATVMVRVGLVITVAVFFARHILSLPAFLILQAVFNGVLVAGLVWILLRRRRSAFVTRAHAHGTAKPYIREFWLYCHPLVAMSFIVLVADILDRWLLQRFAGAVQQGFLGLGLQIGTVVFIFGGATATLSGREFARAHYEQDEDRLREHFLLFLPRAYAVTAFFGVFFAVEAPNLVRIFGGSQYAAAAPATALLCLYPLHQVYGQMGNSLLYATNRTASIRTIGIIGVLLGSALTFFLLAPARLGGLGLGAIGIAVKIVLHQFVVVNIVLFANARYLRVAFWPLLMQQIVAAATLGACAAIARQIAASLSSLPFVAFIWAGAVYACLAFAALWLRPTLVGFNRAELDRTFRAIRSASSAFWRRT